MEINRKLASIQKIAEIKPIEGADAIEAVRVLGWWVVAKKSEFNVGDLVCYFEVDAFIPHELAPFLSKGKEPREFGGVKGEKLRTIRLRGQLSQGLVLPAENIIEYIVTNNEDISLGVHFKDNYDKSYLTKIVKTGTRENICLIDEACEKIYLIEVGLDLTELLGIQKWEAPIPAQLSGKMKGNFPSWARKTDQERCQNLWDEIKAADNAGVRYEISVKLDGSSMSVGMSPDGEYTVCSRNLSLLTDQEGNSFVDLARKLDLESKLSELNRPLMISGELMGPSVQWNQEKLTEHQFFVFDIFDPRTGAYVTSKERLELVNQLGLQHAPILETGVTLSELGIQSLDDLLAYAEGPSINAKHREGVVFKSLDGSFSFKTISNAWLLKTGE
jgi:RNA ligase (TIGR02306 family)